MNGMPPNAGGVNFGAVGASPAIDFWNAWLSAVTALTQQQMQESATLFQQAVTGNFNFNDWGKSLVSMGARWFSLANFPWEWATRSTAQVPMVFFIVDESTETQGPRAVPTPFVVRDAQVEVTDLWQVQGGDRKLLNEPNRPGEPGVRCVEAAVTQGGNRLDVRLVSLLRQTLEPGLYFGVVYARNAQEVTRYPLALVCVLAPLSEAREPVPPMTSVT